MMRFVTSDRSRCSARVLHDDVDDETPSSVCAWRCKRARPSAATMLALWVGLLCGILLAHYVATKRGGGGSTIYNVSPPRASSFADASPAQYASGLDAAGAAMPFSRRWCTAEQHESNSTLQPYETHRTLVAVIAFNRPDFLAWQHRSLESFLPRDSFVHLIFDDSPESEPARSAAIQSEADKLNVTCIRVPQKGVHIGERHPSIMHGETANFVWRYVLAAQWKGPVMFMVRYTLHMPQTHMQQHE